MRQVRSGSHLRQIGDIWYYRRAVPPDARDVFECAEVKISLRTSSRREAERLEKDHDVNFEARLRAARETGPDGHPRNPDARLSHFVHQIFEGDVGEPGYLTRALRKVPEADRDRVREKVEEYCEEGNRLEGELDQFWQEELRDAIRWSDDPEEWKKRRAEIVQLVLDHERDTGNENTIDWAYTKWAGARNRPQQTQDEARRYLDDFKASARVRMLSAVRRRYLTDWRDKLREAGNLSPKSINHRLEIVSAILRTGWREAQTPDAPDLERINLPEPVTSGRTSWTDDEILRDLGALEPASGQAWLFVIALTTGTRIGEPVAARKEWYDPLGFINVPAEFTKMKKPHVMPIIEILREPLAKHVQGLPDGAFMFDVPRPAKPTLKMSHEVSKWFSRFHKKHAIPKVVHELRHTWIEGARHSEIKREIYEIISGHAGTTVSDKYGGAKPAELLKANETICASFLKPKMVDAIRGLVGRVPRESE